LSVKLITPFSFPYNLIIIWIYYFGVVQFSNEIWLSFRLTQAALQQVVFGARNTLRKSSREFYLEITK